MLTNGEVRYWAITLLTAPTARDKQVRLGASDLSDGCDFCLASKFAGMSRETVLTGRAWMGRVLGTAFHAVLENRARSVASFRERFPAAQAERHVMFANLEGYGEVGGTIDLDLGADEDQIIDWKGSERKKLLPLIDYMQTVEGLDLLYGRGHKDVKLSEAQFEETMQKMEYKVTGYYGQTDLYMHGSGRKRASLVFLSRNGTGWFDNPESDRYDDPQAVHDVHVLSFDYDRDYAEALIGRAQRIYNVIAAGGGPGEFERHRLCFPCSIDARDEIKYPEKQAA